MNKDLGLKEKSFIIAVLILFIINIISMYMVFISNSHDKSFKERNGDLICQAEGYKRLKNYHHSNNNSVYIYGSKIPTITLECEK